MKRALLASLWLACTPVTGRQRPDAAADATLDVAPDDAVADDAPDDTDEASGGDASIASDAPPCPSGGRLSLDGRYTLPRLIVNALHPWFNAQPLGAFFDQQQRPIVYGGCLNCFQNTGGRAALWRLPETYLTVESTWAARAGRAFDGTDAEHARYWLTGSADASGRLVVGGYQARAGDTRGVVARFLNTGVIDPEFGTMGRVVLSPDTFDGSRFIPYAQLVDARGLFFVGTDAPLTEGTPTRALALRLTDRGALDTSFGAPHFRDDSLRGCFDVKPDGDRYVLACRAASGRPALYILDGDGRPAPAALHEHPYAPDTFRPNVLERDSAGRWIIVGALTDLDSDRHGVPALVRFLPDGTPDPSYGARGLAQLPGTHRTWQLALRASARLSCQDRMLVGLETNRRPGFAVFRDDGTLATEVGSGGLILVNQAAPEDPFPRSYGLLLARPTAEVALLPWYNALTFNAVRVVQ